jgi:hypothetical protein
VACSASFWSKLKIAVMIGTPIAVGVGIWYLTLKTPPYVLGRRRPRGVKCDPTMKMARTNAGS